ncbi:hypothetical protein PLESTM_000106300 [Pleodorina starrii]|nr:hypothetical protein PLESTM_000106300 [Pleodorina starrii]
MATATASKAPAAATEAGKTTAAVRQRRVRFQCGAETETDVEKLVDAGGLEALHNQGGRGHAPPYPPLQIRRPPAAGLGFGSVARSGAR